MGQGNELVDKEVWGPKGGGSVAGRGRVTSMS